MPLDATVLADLTILFRPHAYLRALLLLHRATPLGMGYGRTRFSSPGDAFKLLYIAEDLTTSVAETLIRDRFVNRRRRRIHRAEAEGWGAARIDATLPLRLLDLRTTGLTRLGVSTDVTGARDHRQGRRLSQAVYDESSTDGMLYRSRLTGELCCAVYDRAVNQLDAGPVIEMASLGSFVPALTALGVSLVS